ncbi:MAG: class I SAM-dependent methyltransferase [Mycobacterium sp.]
MTRQIHDDTQLKQRFYPEANISGLSHIDGMVTFFNQVVAIMRPTDFILDFAAGRGELLIDDVVAHRRNIANFKDRCRHVDGCDVDPVALQDPFLDDAAVITVGRPLPHEDNRFEIVVARSVFEHIEGPGFVACEPLRAVKPRGIIAAATPNKWGYITLAARAMPNRLHVRVLSRSQPKRSAEDVFPTRYRMNTGRALRHAFGDNAEVFITRKAPEPACQFGRPALYRALKSLNKHCPDSGLPVLDVFIRKC